MENGKKTLEESIAHLRKGAVLRRKPFKVMRFWQDWCGQFPAF